MHLLNHQPKIFFFHNPKAAGSAIRSILEPRFAESVRSPSIVNDLCGHEALAGRYRPFQGYDYYGGHYGRDIFESVAAGHLVTTNFRNPVSRVVSLYNYFRHMVTLTEAELGSERFIAVKAAKTLEFGRFVTSSDPRIEVYIRNQHYRQLTASCWSLAMTDSLAETCRFVDTMPWYYVCEHPDLSALWARHALGWTAARLPRANITAGPQAEMIRVEELDRMTCRAICEKNRLDLALYQHAVGRFLQRVTVLSSEADHPETCDFEAAVA